MFLVRHLGLCAGAGTNSHPTPKKGGILEIALSWIVTYTHSVDLPLHRSPYFQLRDTKVPYAKIDVVPEFRYPAVRLDWLKPFHAKMAKMFSEWPLVDHAPSFPYLVSLDDGTQVSVTISATAFYPRILSLRVNVNGAIGQHIDSLADRPALGNIRSHHRIDEVVQAVLRLVVGDVDTGQRIAYQQFPVMRIEKIASNHFSTWQEHFKQSIARVLIRNDSSGTMRDELVHDLFRKAEQFNFKSSREYMLLDKQGLLLLASIESHSANSRLRDAAFNNAICLVEVGLVFQAFLAGYFKLRASRPFFADFILSRIESWCVARGAVLGVSVTNGKIWDLICEELNITEMYRLITGRSYVRAHLDNNMQLFDEWIVGEGAWLEQATSGRDLDLECRHE